MYDIVVELVEVLFVELVIKAELLVDAGAVVVNILFINRVVEWTKNVSGISFT